MRPAGSDDVDEADR